MKIHLSNMQRQILNSTSKYTIIANGRCQGNTVGMLIKALCSGNTSHIVGLDLRKDIVPVIQMLDMKWDIVGKVFDGSERVKLGSGGYLNIHSTSSILRGEMLGLRGGDWYVDIDRLGDIDMLGTNFLVRYGDRFGQIYFTVSPYNCGWRNIRFDKGLPSFDKYNIVECTDKSWDYLLVDWKPLSTNTRAAKEDYIPSVNIINMPEDLVFRNKDFNTCIEDLNPIEIFYVQGEWVKGYDLKESKL